MDKFYQATHLVRIATEHREKPSLQEDSLRRAMDNAEAIPHFEAPISTEQAKQFVREFCRSEEGKRAIQLVHLAKEKYGYRNE